MSEYELRCLYDSCKSFYGKANINVYENEKNELVKELKSYNTIVCRIINGKPFVYGTYSNTTLRHIKEFLRQEGFKVEDINDVRSFFPSEEDKRRAEAEQEQKFKGLFDSLKMVCAMGDVMNESQQEKNEFKKRMLKAGLGEKGLSFPSDWESLSEAEKEKRLNGALEQI